MGNMITRYRPTWQRPCLVESEQIEIKSEAGLEHAQEGVAGQDFLRSRPA